MTNVLKNVGKNKNNNNVNEEDLHNRHGRRGRSSGDSLVLHGSFLSSVFWVSLRLSIISISDWLHDTFNRLQARLSSGNTAHAGISSKTIQQVEYPRFEVEVILSPLDPLKLSLETTR